MKENVLDILMFMFDNFLDDGQDFDTEQHIITGKLAEAGFRKDEIDRAFVWLQDLSAMCEQSPQTTIKASRSLRQCTTSEQQKLDMGARGYLLFLEQHGILDSTTREMVIDRVMALDIPEFNLEQLKWVIMMVLYNQPDHKQSFAWFESMVCDEVQGYLH